MTFERKSETSEFAHNFHAVGVGEIHFGSGIFVKVKNIAHTFEMITARSGVYEACGVKLLCINCYIGGFELSPTLVKRCPYHNAGMVFEVFYYFFPFRAKIALAFGTACHLVAGKPMGHVPLVVLIIYLTARHVLPNHHSHSVAILIPQIGFHFHVFANHVEAPLLGFVNVINHCLVSGCGVYSVGPVTLVKGTHLEERLVVKHHDEMPAFASALRNFAHGCIAAHGIHRFAARHNLYVKTVKVRVVGAP